MDRDRETPPDGAGDITRLLRQSQEGDAGAHHALYERTYGELHQIARAHAKNGSSSETLRPTALVNEAWLRMVNAGSPTDEWQDRKHFLAVASRAMRTALIDHVRKRGADKRSGDRSYLPFDDLVAFHEERGVDLIALDEALEELAEEEPRQAKVVELRFFGGLTMPELATTLGVSRATADRDWRLARIWLLARLGAAPGEPRGTGR